MINTVEKLEPLTEKFDGNNIHWIEKCGHYPMLENPKEWIEAVLKA